MSTEFERIPNTRSRWRMFRALTPPADAPKRKMPPEGVAILGVSAAAAAISIAFVAVKTDLAAIQSPPPSAPLVAAASLAPPAPPPAPIAAPPAVREITLTEPRGTAPVRLDPTATGAIHAVAAAIDKHKHKHKKPVAADE